MNVHMPSCKAPVIGQSLMKLGISRHAWGDPNVPGIVKKNYLKYLYKFETLVLFEVLPLRLDAAIPAPLPIWKHCLKSPTEMLSTVASESHTYAAKHRPRTY
jgi:hypothetical protein